LLPATNIPKESDHIYSFITGIFVIFGDDTQQEEYAICNKKEGILIDLIINLMRT